MTVPHETADGIVREYLERTGRSRALHERFSRVMPAGQTRTITHFDPYPVVVAGGEGALLRDVDGNEYVDVLNNYTSLVHGHRHPGILGAVRAALGSGTAFPAPHQSQLELAELLCARFPAAEQVRFTNSGSEATLLALRIARAATRRPRVVAFEGGYHGTLPELADGGPDLVRVPYNDVTAATAALDASVAAVVVEPFLGSGGVVPALPGFLDEVRARAAEAGALFVLDEVQSLRNRFDGVHGELGLAPDLVLMGKVIGGGFPVGAVAGRAELLAFTDPRHPRALAHSGTFNGNVVTSAAGAASLRLLDEGAVEQLNERAAWLAPAIEAAAARAGVTAVVSRAGSIMQVHAGPTYPTAASSPPPEARDLAAALHLALLLEGVYAAPRGMLNLTTVMTDDHLAAVASGYGRAFARVRAALGDPVVAGGSR
jgi:glutamate-1-semialdehyde 2,1-aminomutase